MPRTALHRLAARCCGDRRGAAMLMVIFSFAIFVLLAGAMLTLAVSSGSAASGEVYGQQSYLNARSANLAAIALAKKAAAAEDASDAYYTLQTKLSDVLASGTSYTLRSSALGGVGKTTVTFTRTLLDDGTYALKVSATSPGTGNLSAAHTVTATMQWPAGSDSADSGASYANPFNNLRYISSQATYQNPHCVYGAAFLGTMTYYGTTSLGNMTVKGDLVQIADEDQTLSGSNDADLYLGDGYNANAVSGSGTVKTLYNVSTTRNLHIGKCYNSSSGWKNDSGHQAYCFDTLTVNGNLIIDNNAQVYVKHLYLSGSLSINSGAQLKKLRISGSSVTTSLITSKRGCDGEASFKVTYPEDLPMRIGYDTGMADSSGDSSVSRTENDGTIVSYENNMKTSVVNTTRSSTLNVTSGLLRETQVQDGSKTVYINTGTAANTPVRLVFTPRNTSDHTFTINSDIVVTGSNYLYIYLPDDGTYSVKTVEMNGSIYWATSDWRPDYTSAPKIIIIESHSTTDRAFYFSGAWKFGQNSVLRAFLYTPHFEWKNLNGSNWSGDARSGGNYDKDFFGSALVSDETNFTLMGAVRTYCPPPSDGTYLFAGTPLQNIATGLYARQIGSGTVKGWSNK